MKLEARLSNGDLPPKETADHQADFAMRSQPFDPKSLAIFTVSLFFFFKKVRFLC